MLSYLSDLLPAFLKIIPCFLIRKHFRENKTAHSSPIPSFCCTVPQVSGSNRTMTHSPMVLSKPSLSDFYMDTNSTHTVPLSLLGSTCLLNAPLLPLQEEEEVGSHRLPGHFSLTLPFFLFFLSFYFLSFSLSSFPFLYHCHHHKVVF